MIIRSPTPLIINHHHPHYKPLLFFYPGYLTISNHFIFISMAWGLCQPCLDMLAVSQNQMTP